MNELKVFRQSQNMTRKEMAEKLGVSLSFYEKVEMGDRSLSGNFIRRLKEAFPLVDLNIFSKLNYTRSI